MADLGFLGGAGGTIGKAVVQLELDTKKYIAEMKGAQAATVAGANSLGGTLSKLGGAAVTGIAGIGVALTALMVKGVATFTNVAAEVRKLEGQLGTTAEQASVLRAQGEALGVDVDQLSTGFGILAKHLVANDDVLQQYGIDVVRTADGQVDFQAVLAQLSETFSGMGPGVDRTAAAMNLFGRSGKSLLPLLAANSDELATFAANAEKAGLIMSQADVDAARALTIAQRELGQAWEGLQVQLARAVIPMLTDLAHIVTVAVRELAPFLPLIRNIGLAFLGWKALTFIPDLLENIASGLDALDLTAQAVDVLDLAKGASALGASFTTAAAAAAAFATAYIGLTAAVAAWDPLNLVGDVDKLRESMTVTTQTFGDSEVILGRVAVSQNLLGGATAATSQTLGEMQQKAGLAESGITSLAGAMENEKQKADAVTLALRSQLDATLALAEPTFALVDAVRSDAEAEDRLAAAHHALNELRDKGAQGTFKYREALDEVDAAALNAAESQASLFGAVRKFQQEVATGEATRAEAITAIRDLGKEAGLSGKEIRGLVDDVRAGISGAAAYARQHAPDIGTAMMEGIKLGITTHSELVSVAAAQAVHDAIQAARDAAKAGSPSKVMAVLGLDMMQGLTDGISAGAQKVIDMARGVIEKAADEVSSQLDKIKGKASSFADTIRGAFSEFADLGGNLEGFGGNLDATIAAAVGGAQQLADVLKELKREGASKALLAEVAQNPELGSALLGDQQQIADANAALKEIAELSRQTGKALSEQFFGNKIDKLENKLDRLHDDLKELAALERLGHSHDIVLEGEKVSTTTEKGLTRILDRRGSLFNGAVRS